MDEWVGQKETFSFTDSLLYCINSHLSQMLPKANCSLANAKIHLVLR